MPLPGATLADTYLNPAALVGAAQAAGADALHPGYGFLSENPALPEACAEAGIVWVGPPPEAMRVMGHKARAKERRGRRRRPGAAERRRGRRGTARRTARPQVRASATRSWSRPRPGEGAGGCDWCTSRASSPRPWPRHSGRPPPRSVRTRCSWSATSPRRATSRSRSSGTAMATCCTCSTASARCSAGTRRWSKRRRPCWCPPRPAATCGTRPWRRRKPSTTWASARSSTWSTRAASTSSR